MLLQSLPSQFAPVRLLAERADAVVVEVFVGDSLKVVTWHHDPDGDIAYRARQLALVRDPVLIGFDEVTTVAGNTAIVMPVVADNAATAWVREAPAPAVAWGSLASLVYTGFDEHRVRTTVAQLARGLAKLHAAGQVHGAVAAARLRVTDAGAPVLLAPSMTRTRHRAEVTDLIGLGEILFEFITGRRPWVDDDDRAWAAPRPSQLVPEVARELDVICAALLEGNRALTAAEVAARLGAPVGPRDGSGAAIVLPAAPAAPTPALAAARAGLTPGRLVALRGAPAATTAALAELAAAAAVDHHVYLSRPLTGGPVAAIADAVARHLATLSASTRARLLADDAEPIARRYPSFRRLVAVGDCAARPDALRAGALAGLARLLTRLAATAPVVVAVDRPTGDDRAALAALWAAAPTVALAVAVDDDDPWAADAVEAVAPPPARVPWAELPDGAHDLARTLVAAATATRLDVLGSALGVAHRELRRVLSLLIAGGWAVATGPRRHDLAALATGVEVPVVPAPTDHAALASAFEYSQVGTVADRRRHWTAAGDASRVTALAREQIAGAADTLACADALATCESALTMGPSDIERVGLERARADALAALGESVAAADAYLTAAALAARAGLVVDEIDARQRATEPLLRSGQVERGFATVRAVAHAVGMEIAETSQRTAARLAVERAKARNRGLTLAGELDPGAARLADVCTSLAMAMSIIDNDRAAWMTSRAVRAAVDSGDPVRAARALALDAQIHASRGAVGVARARRQLEVAERMQATLPAPAPERRAVAALVATSHAAVALHDGAFVDALTFADQARALYQGCRPAVGAEARVAATISVAAAAWLGRWREVGARRRDLAGLTDDSGDQHSPLSVACGMGVVADLATGEHAAARARCDHAAQVWPPSMAPIVPAMATLTLASCDLFAGASTAAYQRLADRARTAQPHGDLLRTALVELAARAALAAGVIPAAIDHSTELETVPWCRGPAMAVRAAAVASEPDQALSLLTEAETLTRSAGLAAHAAAIGDRLGRMVGGDHGRIRVAEAAAQATELGLGDPARAFAFLLPWAS
ncbi:MAG: hypothetical protein R3B06_08405 [Kofleriaceae bacterium]